MPLRAKLLLASVIILALILHSLNAFFMFFSVYLIFILSQWDHRTTTFGPITKLLLSFILYILSLQSVLIFGWVLNSNYPLDLTIPFLCFGLLLTVAIQYRRGKLKLHRAISNERTNQLFKDDIVASLTALVLTFALIAFSLFSYGHSHPDFILSFINNVDDSSHLAMINDRIQFNRGITTNSDAVSTARSTGMYPAGWHSSIALIIKALSPTIRPGTSTLKAYVATKIILFGILAFVTTRFSIDVAGSFMTTKQRRGFMRIVVSVLSLVLLSVLLFDIFREGFYSFLPQLIGIMLTFIILHSIKSSNSQNTDNPWLTATAWFILISLSLAWVLVLPVMLLAFGAFLCYLYGRSTISFIKATLFSHPILVVSPVLAIIVTYVSMSGSSEAVGLSVAILNQGGIASYPLNFHLLLVFSILMTLSVATRKAYTSIFPAISAICLLIFATCVLYYQTASVGAPRYYYYKILYVFMFAALPLTVGIIYRYLKSVARTSIILGLSALGLISTVLFWQFVNPSTIAFVSGTRHLGPEVRKSIYANMDTYRENSHTLYYIAGHSTVMDNATNLMHTNEKSTQCREKAWEAVLSGAKFSSIIRQTNQYCKNYHIKIIAASFSKKDIEKEFATHGKPSNIEVEYLYINPPKD